MDIDKISSSIFRAKLICIRESRACEKASEVVQDKNGHGDYSIECDTLHDRELAIHAVDKLWSQVIESRGINHLFNIRIKLCLIKNNPNVFSLDCP